MNWDHLIWAVVVGGLLTSAVVVMGTFGLASRSLSDFAVLLYLRLALLSGLLFSSDTIIMLQKKHRPMSLAVRSPFRAESV